MARFSWLAARERLLQKRTPPLVLPWWIATAYYNTGWTPWESRTGSCTKKGSMIVEAWGHDVGTSAFPANLPCSGCWIRLRVQGPGNLKLRTLYSSAVHSHFFGSQAGKCGLLLRGREQRVNNSSSQKPTLTSGRSASDLRGRVQPTCALQLSFDPRNRVSSLP